MSISADTLRGHTDTIILAQLMRGDNYGYEINKNIQQLTHPRVQAAGAVRPHRLLLGGRRAWGPAAVLLHHGGGPGPLGGGPPGMGKHTGAAGRADFD